jgi:hypothetical protein
MRTIKLFAFILLLVTLKVYSQTEPSGPMTFTYKLNGSTTTASLDAAQHTQDEFLYGFQWSGSVKMMFGFQWASAKFMNDSLSTNCVASLL